MPRLSPFDRCIVHFDQALRTLTGQPAVSGRPNPAKASPNHELTPQDKQLSMRLMRVNHAGEIAAQALYQGQALTARQSTVQASMQQAAREENDHLVWCRQRVHELGGRVSLLSPVWYMGSLTIGAAAGAAGDKWSLGFVAETEKQVVAHIDEHLQRLSTEDQKSRAILMQMQTDEAQHATVAVESGGVPLPLPIRWLMQQAAKVMTRTAFWI